MLADRARFPRDKVCAGWLTPGVFTLLDLDPDEYRAAGLTLQEISRFPDRRDRQPAHRNALPTRRQLRDPPVRVRRLPRSAAPACAYSRERRSRRSRRGRGAVDCQRLHRDAGGHRRRRAFLSRRQAPARRAGHVAADRRQGSGVSPGRSRAGAVDTHPPELLFCRDLEGYALVRAEGRVPQRGHRPARQSRLRKARQATSSRSSRPTAR